MTDVCVMTVMQLLGFPVSATDGSAGAVEEYMRLFDGIDTDRSSTIDMQEFVRLCGSFRPSPAAAGSVGAAAEKLERRRGEATSFVSSPPPVTPVPPLNKIRSSASSSTPHR